MKEKRKFKENLSVSRVIKKKRKTVQLLLPYENCNGLVTVTASPRITL